MDYQFTHTAYGVVAKCSMDHEAFAFWLNSEISQQENNDLPLILDKVTQCKATLPNHFEWLKEGKEYSLYIEDDEVMVKSNSLEAPIDESEIESGFHFYSQESLAFCGIDDFEAFLLGYQKCLNTYH